MTAVRCLDADQCPLCDELVTNAEDVVFDYMPSRIVYVHRCGACGTRWATWWSAPSFCVARVTRRQPLVEGEQP